MEISKNDSSLEEVGLEIPLELVAMKVELAVVQQRCSMRGLAQVGGRGGNVGQREAGTWQPYSTILPKMLRLEGKYVG